MDSDRGAGARLTVDLDAIAANWRTVRDTAITAEAAAVLKADAYGLGLAPVARRLAAEGCRTFFTALASEGEALRRACPHARILVLSPVVALDAEVLERAALVPCLPSIEEVDAWVARARDRGRPLPAALHAETGINRLGMAADAVHAVATDPSRRAHLELVLVMSHLASADAPADPASHRQRERFDAVRAMLPGVAASLANSAGVFLGADYHYQLVRPGICLYGHDPHVHLRDPRVRPVAHLHATLAQVKTVAAGEGIGYGATHVCAAPTRIGVVLAGYADGVRRSLSWPGAGPRYVAAVGGHPAPILGRVSMDMITLDLGAVPTTVAVPGAMVELIGPAVPIETMAGCAGTIPYEVLTGISPRVRRAYLPTAEGRAPGDTR
ncbi:MAG: alanine racemase [Ectothiorhodospiraceae bacterium]|nr:alanine racemase [Ectothiorhodospiraceae bacterium]